MTCAELNGLLDRLMDGELSDEELRALEAHGQTCPDCAEAIRVTKQLKALFAEMEPEADVPLEAQAKWRGAVRAEAGGARRRRLTRWIGSAAAAVVVLVGVGLALKLPGAPAKDTATVQVQAAEVTEERTDNSVKALSLGAEVGELDEAYAPDAGEVPEALFEEESAGPLVALKADAADADYAVMAPPEAGASAASEESFEAETIVEADGESLPMCAALAQRAPACELRLRVEKPEEICDRISDLAQEYEGQADIQPLEAGGANVYVEVATGDAEAFLKAVTALAGPEEEAKLPELSKSTTVLMLIVVNGEN